MLHPGKLAVMTEWAGKYGCTVQTRGEVGFGRPCVGIVHGNAYVDTSNNDWYGDYKSIPPPEGVTDAYHKHDCMAVLVRPDGDWDNILEECYDAALEQLNIWVEWCIENDYGIKIESRRTMNTGGFGRHLEIMMGGPTQARLVPLGELTDGK